MLFLEPGGAAVFHGDFTPVSAGHPAQLGEWLISKAADLGPTSPAKAPDQPFPRDPLALVTSPVSVHVNGITAQVRNLIGWPGETDAYRLDFRVPSDIGAGMAKIVVTVGSVSGLPTVISVR